jgi:phenylalanyl-tRNA synthetase beta chain
VRVLLSWLRDFAPFEGDPVALGDQMSDLGMAVESMQPIGEGLEGVVVAEVLALRPHPDADRVQLVDVDAGDGEARQIVCGAFNMSIGDRVPLATLGAVLPGGLRIERRKMRGEWSNGMLCSSTELGLGDDDRGILVLPPTVELGSPLRVALGIDTDVLYDLEINPNRPDALSVAGVARDLAARLGLPFQLPEPSVVERDDDIRSLASVEIVDGDLCGRFLARILRNVSVTTSPPWMASRLLALGMRPINSIVDVSNYVMLELGQPNHTYDLAKVPGGALRVRWAGAGERLVTLDGVERELGTHDGVIADRTDTPIGIAGVMGGASTEINRSTTDVLLEMAWWHPMAIAVSSKRLGLRSEASMRFERGTDPGMIDLAARRFAELLAGDGASLVVGEVDELGDLPAPARVRVRTDRVNSLLGTALDRDEVASYLEPIGFACETVGIDLDVVVPSFRPDTTTETDVIEEVARHHGYGAIASTVPSGVRRGFLTEHQRVRRSIRDAMAGMGLDEAMPLPFLAPGDLERVGVSTRAVTITNPLVADESVLRTSLRPGLLRTVAFNHSHRVGHVALFEIGRVFQPADGEVLPHEPEHLAAVLLDRDATAAVEVWSTLVDVLAVAEPDIDQRPIEGLHPTRSGELRAGGQPVGLVGEIDPAVLASFDLTDRAAWLEVDLERLLSLPRRERRYRQVSRYPSSDVDLAFEVDEGTPAATLARVIREAGGDELVTVRLFDVYRGEAVPEGTRSLAYTLRLQATDRTLTDDEVAVVRRRIIEAVEQRLPARLRG